MKKLKHTHEYASIPDHMVKPIQDYLVKGCRPGGFLTAVLSNNFIDAIGRADSKNLENIHAWAMWLFNECPSNAWGSPEIVEEYIQSRLAARVHQEYRGEKINDEIV